MVFGLVSSTVVLTDALTLVPSPTDRDTMDPDASTLNFLKAVCRLSSSPSLASDFIVKASVLLLMFPPVNTPRSWGAPGNPAPTAPSFSSYHFATPRFPKILFGPPNLSS